MFLIIVILDLLSSFDSYRITKISCGPLWFSIAFSLIVVIKENFRFLRFLRVLRNKILSVGGSLVQGISGQYVRGVRLRVTRLFLFLIMINLIGLFPFSFRISSHVSFGPCSALFMWFRLWASGLRISWRQTMCTLIPRYAPMFLVPFLFLVEIVTIRSRPLTLGLRLIINLTAGHLIMRILTNVNSGVVLAGLYNNIFNSAYGFQLLGYFSSIGLLGAEIIIGILQAFIFCTLLGLYRNEHAL